MHLLATGALVAAAAMLPTNATVTVPTRVSNIYPQLAMINEGNDCATAAVVPWADRSYRATVLPANFRWRLTVIFEMHGVHSWPTFAR